VSSEAQASTGDPFTAEPKISAVQRWRAPLLIGTITVAWMLMAYLSYVRTVRWSGGLHNAESIGYFTGGLLTPFLIAAFLVWLAKRVQKDKMSPAMKQGITAYLALGIAVLAFVGSLQQAPRFDETAAKKQMGHLLKQAAGKEAPTADSEWYASPARQFFSDILAFNQEYADAIRSLDQSAMAKLYTPGSYTTRARIQTMISQLQGTLDLDRKYESLDPVLKKMEAHVSAASASEYEKEEFIKGVRSSASKTLAPRQETFRTAEEWLESSIVLYNFALAHIGDYTIKNKKLIFHATGLRDQFLDLQSKSIALRKTAIEAKHKLETARQDTLSQAGLTPSDISSPEPKAK
jgi:hypothetical protein